MKEKVKRRPWSELRPRIVGIKNDARVLGVSRQHLYLVLHGLRAGAPTLRRYHLLKEAQKQVTVE